MPAPADPMKISPEYEAALERYPAQVEELGGRGVAGYALQPSTTATSVRDGDLVTDGPFIEAKEVVAGFFGGGALSRAGLRARRDGAPGAWLVSEPTMAARVTRAKKKITAAAIPYRVPDADKLSAPIWWTARWSWPGCSWS
ncbi:YciI family protein [Nonomuraea zeae]|uniref:YciI family protein n=1 Tax=Nonomuraea zeae TaxID=1642303 RepID=UPI0019804832|nr:hypothetical protein [Nonomuraea zeae]